jgi:hypothetical protein
VEVAKTHIHNGFQLGVKSVSPTKISMSNCQSHVHDVHVREKRSGFCLARSAVTIGGETPPQPRVVYSPDRNNRNTPKLPPNTANTPPSWPNAHSSSRQVFCTTALRLATHASAPGRRALGSTADSSERSSSRSPGRVDRRCPSSRGNRRSRICRRGIGWANTGS